MHIAILQFAPSLGAFEENIKRANTFLSPSKLENVDLLVLPEMAFSGYNFPNLSAIKPFLEPTASGPTSHWAIRTAQQYNCFVIVGYPEIATLPDGTTRNYNATVTVDRDGKIVNNYRKSFLYYTDETWASEGFDAAKAERPFFCDYIPGLGRMGHGICMDINPYQFTAPWTAYEFANAMLTGKVHLVVLSMAWLTRLLPTELAVESDQPDMATVSYWVERFRPLMESRDVEETIVVLANRCGTEGNLVGVTHVENGMEVEEGDRVCYAGSSCVMRIRGTRVNMFERRPGKVAILGKAEEGVLVVDTTQPAVFQLQSVAA